MFFVIAHLGRRAKTEFGSCDKRRYSFTRHFSQHVVLRRHDVRYAVFKEQAPHQGPAVAKAADATLSERCVRSKLNSADRIVLPIDLLNANHVAARILSLWGPDGRRNAMSFVFDLVKIDCVSSRSSHLACCVPNLRSAYDI
jgi:hypothetical protein